jgi:flavin-binding protein dodecin
MPESRRSSLLIRCRVAGLGATGEDAKATGNVTQTTTTTAKEADVSVYRVIDVIGTSADSWEDAAKTAITTASSSLRDLRVAEVVEQDLALDDGNVTFRTKLRLSFKYEEG